jgi:hypothetical protein
MNETIRDYIRRRVRWTTAIYVAALALVVAPVVFAFAAGTLNARRELFNLSRAASLLIIVGGAVLMTRIKCPKCDKPLGSTAFSLATRQRQAVNFCPNCGVSFDEPMPHKVVS